MTLPNTMRAMEIGQPGGPEALQLCTRPVPRPGEGEILIRLACAGVNRPDLMQRAGNYPPPPGASDLPGLEGAGTVAAVGPGVRSWSVGDEVCALLPGGGYAEYAITHADHALPVPHGMSMDKAACLPENYFTVWSNVFARGGLAPGERFLVHGGSSGIGTTAIQLASHFGAEVFATAGSAEKCMACEKLGADRAINYREEDFVEVLTGAGGANVILDMVGGDYMKRNLQSLADDGRLVLIALQKGAVAELNFLPILVRRLTITGSALRPQSIAAKAAIASELRANVWPLLDEGEIGPIMDSSFDLEDAASAHAHMEGGTHIGKVVLRIGS